MVAFYIACMFHFLLWSINSFNLSSCSCCTIFVEAGLKIWQETFLFLALFNVAVLFCTTGTFWVASWLFLKLKAFSKTFLCPAVTTIPAGELIIPGLVTGVFRDIQVNNLEIKMIVENSTSNWLKTQCDLNSCATGWKFILMFSFKCACAL